MACYRGRQVTGYARVLPYDVIYVYFGRARLIVRYAFDRFFDLDETCVNGASDRARFR